ncbi:MAG: PAS domain-containing protein [Methanoculleaceae archaeon]
MYIDDEPGLLEICKIYLQRTGLFNVTTSESGIDALKTLERSSFDAIVSDYQMPEFDGIQLLKHIRAHGDKTPFIIFTGKGREEVAIEALNSGADFYLQKGGDPKAQFAELQRMAEYAIQRSRLEQLIQQNEVKYRTLFETTGTATALLEEDGTISLANSEFEQLSGYSRDEIEGRIHWQAFVVTKDKEKMQTWHRLRREGPDAAPKEYEFRFINRSGEIRHIFLKIDLIPGTTTSIASLTDITDLKRMEEELIRNNEELASAYEEITAIEEEIRQQYDQLAASEAALRESEERLRSIIDVAPVGAHIYRMDDDGNLIFSGFNRAADTMLGVSHEQFLGKTIEEAFPKLAGTPIPDAYRQVAATGKPFHSEQVEYDEGSTSGIFEVSAVQIPDGVAAFFRDIIRSKRAEEELQRANR